MSALMVMNGHCNLQDMVEEVEEVEKCKTPKSEKARERKRRESEERDGVKISIERKDLFPDLQKERE